MLRENYFIRIKNWLITKDNLMSRLTWWRMKRGNWRVFCSKGVIKLRNWVKRRICWRVEYLKCNLKWWVLGIRLRKLNCCSWNKKINFWKNKTCNFRMDYKIYSPIWLKNSQLIKLQCRLTRRKRVEIEETLLNCICNKLLIKNNFWKETWIIWKRKDFKRKIWWKI